MKLSVLVAVPPGVVTEILPVEPLPTFAVIWVAEFTVKLEAAVPPMLTAVVPLKLVPVMVSEVPLPPSWGEGADRRSGIVSKAAVLVAVPPGVVTEILPVEPLPTIAVIRVLEFTVKLEAAVPPILTAVAPLRLVPVMVAKFRCRPAGVKEVIVGAA